MLQRFQEVVEQHKDMVYSFAFYHLGNREEAEDVTQEVLLRLWQSWQKMDFGSVGAWLNRVTRNACIDRTRRRGSYRAVVAEDDGKQAARAEAPSPGPEAEAAAAGFRRHLRRALSEISEPYRSVVILREIRGLKYDEISCSLKMPLGSVKGNLHRGRRMLRERLEETYGYAGTRELGV